MRISSNLRIVENFEFFIISCGDKYKWETLIKIRIHRQIGHDIIRYERIKLDQNKKK